MPVQCANCVVEQHANRMEVPVSCAQATSAAYVLAQPDQSDMVACIFQNSSGEAKEHAE